MALGLPSTVPTHSQSRAPGHLALLSPSPDAPVRNQGLALERVTDSSKDLVPEVNIDASPAGISLQAMDASHVAPCVALNLTPSGFQNYRAARPVALGVPVGHLTGGLEFAAVAVAGQIALTAKEEGRPLGSTFDKRRPERKESRSQPHLTRF